MVVIRQMILTARTCYRSDLKNKTLKYILFDKFQNKIGGIATQKTEAKIQPCCITPLPPCHMTLLGGVP